MVRMAVCCAPSAAPSPVGPKMRSRTVSAGSSIESFVMGTMNEAVVAPAAKLTGLTGAEKSTPPPVAVPAWACTCTVTPLATPPVRFRVIVALPAFSLTA